jgi:transcription antitermination factor NusG
MALENLNEHFAELAARATQSATANPFQVEITASFGAWHVIIAEPNREVTAVRHLGSRGFGAYLPEFDIVKRFRGSTRKLRRPLFPGYVFVFTWQINEQRRRIEACAGVTSILQKATKDGDPVPVVIEDGLIAQIQATEFNLSRYGIVPERPRRKPRLRRWEDDEVVQISTKSYFTGIEKLATQDRNSVLHRALGLVS